MSTVKLPHMEKIAKPLTVRDNYRLMAEQLKDRVQARLDAVGLKARGASLKAGLSGDFVRGILRGQSKSPHYQNLRKLAEVLECSPEYLQNGEHLTKPPQNNRNLETNKSLGPTNIDMELSTKSPIDLATLYESTRDIPVLGTAAGGPQGAFQLSNDEIARVPRAPGLLAEKNAYCLYVIGNSMAPWKRSGWPIFVSPSRPYSPGDYVVVQVQNGENEEITAYVKMFVRENQKSLVLEQHKPKKTLTLKRETIVAVHKVLTDNEIWGL